MVMITFYGRPTVTDQWECSLGERYISAVSFKSNDQTSKAFLSEAVLYPRVICLFSLLRVTKTVLRTLKVLIYENG